MIYVSGSTDRGMLLDETSCRKAHRALSSPTSPSYCGLGTAIARACLLSRWGSIERTSNLSPWQPLQPPHSSASSIRDHLSRQAGDVASPTPRRRWTRQYNRTVIHRHSCPGSFASRRAMSGMGSRLDCAGCGTGRRGCGRHAPVQGQSRSGFPPL